MGIHGSIVALKLKRNKLTHHLIHELEESTHFNSEEIKILYSRFKDLVKVHKHKASISIPDFKDSLGVSDLRLAECVFTAFDKDGDKTIDFVEFAHGMSVISERATIEEKIRFIFDVFDPDRDGLVKTNELKEIMLLICKEKLTYLPEEQMEVLVQTTCNKIDSENKGVITFKQFEESVSDYPFLHSFTSLDIKKYLGTD
ncbi:EF hand family protein [Histomonas meleagridis]|uniref:EF hand family protein n=1 Tax=Histomonas meleagridis TaxID=135588 RepID=UPI00355A2D1D|nr:EF hand family protein [Histomonas meleagridis]KAH0798757.1 EF hand family protein [Histomonas meleagridis]